LTDEGIYLIQHSQIAKSIYKELEQLFPKIDQRALSDLQLADVDFASFETAKRELNVRIQICSIFMNTLKVIESH
jgi:hypothetical protein